MIPVSSRSPSSPSTDRLQALSVVAEGRSILMSAPSTPPKDMSMTLQVDHPVIDLAHLPVKAIPLWIGGGSTNPIIDADLDKGLVAWFLLSNLVSDNTMVLY